MNFARPMVPPAPPMFSTTMLWPKSVAIDWLMARATASLGPPAGNGTMSVIDRDGNAFSPDAALCAPALPAIAQNIAAARRFPPTPAHPFAIIFIAHSPARAPVDPD